MIQNDPKQLVLRPLGATVAICRWEKNCVSIECQNKKLWYNKQGSHFMSMGFCQLRLKTEKTHCANCACILESFCFPTKVAHFKTDGERVQPCPTLRPAMSSALGQSERFWESDRFKLVTKSFAIVTLAGTNMLITMFVTRVTPSDHSCSSCSSRSSHYRDTCSLVRKTGKSSI